MKTVTEKFRWLGLAFLGSILLGLFVLKPSPVTQSTAGVSEGALILAGLLVGIIVWLKKRKSLQATQKNRRIRLLEEFRFSQGRSLHLVEADGSRLLLSESSDGLRLLVQMDNQGSSEGKP